MAIKLAATDLDGTLISADGLTISRENLDSMKSASEKGVYIVPTTGRSFFEMPPELRAEKPYNYCICSNGAVILDRDDREIWKSTFSKELVLKLYEILSKYDTMIEFYANGKPQTKREYLCKESYVHFNVEEEYHEVLTISRNGIESEEDFLKNHAEDVEMFNIYFSDMKEREEAFALMEEIGGIETTTSMQSNMEILQKGVNKGCTLERLFGILGVSKDEALAIGDSRNDISMFKAVGLPLAVSNACDALKEYAKEVIVSCDESAMAYALKKYAREEK